MKRLGHHCYTSLGGYKTVHCSPWLESVRALLDKRAQSCYNELGRFDCIRCDGLWIATFVIANGVDHVRRPRTLVHQIVYEAINEPPIFSPFFLKLACLDRLDHEDPALEQRLVTDFEKINLREHMPHPQQFREVLRGDTAAVLLGFYESTLNIGHTETCTVQIMDGLAERIRPGLCLATLHGIDFHISSLKRPLSYPSSAQMPSLRIMKEGEGSSSSTALSTILPASSQCILDIFLQSDKPHLLLFLFRHLSVRRLVRGEGTTALFRMVLDQRMELDNAGLPIVNAHFVDVAHVLITLGGSVLIQHVIQKWLVELSILNDPVLAGSCTEYVEAINDRETFNACITFLKHHGITVQGDRL